MAPQQFRLVAYDPSRQGIFLSLNASAIYIGASVGSALGGHVILNWDINGLGLAGSAVALIAIASLWFSERVMKSRY